MEPDELRPGLWRWTTFHPEWRQDVASVAHDGTDALVLIDPLLEAEHVLDGLVERVGKPVVVLVTVYWHTRSADVVARRYGARVLAPSGGRAAVKRRAETAEAFTVGDELPGGVEAFPTARSSEVVYWIRAERTLVPGDVLLGAADGGLRLCPQGWLPSGRTVAELATSLRPLLELPVARVLVSHGQPVLRGGHAALERALTA